MPDGANAQAMNYRHAFHAGNFADVLKHATLALVIEHLKLKPAAFRVIDTHAGCGAYDLGSLEAERTGEWRDGIGRLIGPESAALPPAVEPILKPYLEAVWACNPSGGLARYPGSPALALALMRHQDRLIANELHPEDQRALAASIGRDARAKVMNVDGWHALKALLPPKERRGVVLIDPPFEEAGEPDRLITGLKEAHRRFETGIFLLWLPIKDQAQAQRFYTALARTGPEKILLAELRVRTAGADGRLAATALVIVNPPYRLDASLGTMQAFFAERLAQGDGSRHRLAWLAGSS